MAALTGNKIKDSYLGLLKTTDSGIFTSSLIRITDGGGNGSQLYLSNTAIRFHNAYTFPNADGTSGQVLSTDGSGNLYFTESSDNQTLEEVLTSGNTATLAILSTADGNTFGSTTFDDAVTGTTANFTTSVTSPSFIGDIDGALIQQVKAAETLVKGDVVYISGGTGDNPEVSKAKADSSTTMAALGIIKNNIAEDDVGECITSGELTGLGTLLGSFATGDDLYVSATTAGALVTTAPTGVTNLIQKIGKVIKGGNGGALTVLGAFRVNASPNLPTGILLGDTTNVSTAITDGSVGQILSTDGSGSYSFIDNDEGTVTSVALSVPTGLTVTGSPITTSGTIAIGGTLGVANGGTGATTLTGILVGNGTSAISVVSDGIVSGQVLSTDGSGTYSFIDAGTGDVTVDGASVGNRVAVWNNTTGELRGTSAIATENSNIYLSQPSTNGTDKFNYIIGGAFAINENDFGTQNTGFGHRVFNGADLTGGNNSAFGLESLYSLTTGSHNTSIGSFAMHDNRSGNYNVGLGTKAMFNQRISNYNVAIGYDSMDGVTASQTAVSDYNTAVGYQSLQSIQGGDNNTVIGKDSGNAITTGSNNVIIGSNTGSTIATSSNNIIISDGGGNIRQSFDINGDATFSGVVSTTSASSIGFLAQTTANSVYPYFRWVANNRSYWAAAIDNGTDATFKIGSGNTIDIGSLFEIDSFTNTATFSGSVTAGVSTFNSDGGGTALKFIARLAGETSTLRFYANDGTTQNAWIGSSNSNFDINSVANYPLTFRTNDTLALTINTSQNATFSSSVTAASVGTGGSSAVYSNLESSTPTFNSTVALLSLAVKDGTYNPRATVSFKTQTGSAYSVIFDSIYSSGWAATNWVFNTGNLGIGTAAPTYQLQLSTNSAAKPSTNTWTVASDSRVKENIRDYTRGLEAILKITPKWYDYNGKAGFEKIKDNIGVIAQDMIEVMPETIKTYKAKLNEEDEEDTELYNYDSHAVTFALINAVKEQQTIIEDLKARIETLEG